MQQDRPWRVALALAGPPTVTHLPRHYRLRDGIETGRSPRHNYEALSRLILGIASLIRIAASAIPASRRPSAKGLVAKDEAQCAYFLACIASGPARHGHLLL